MKKSLIILLLLFSTGFLVFCSDNSSETAELDVDEAVIEQASFGYEINDIINSGKEVEEVTDPTELDPDNEYGLFDTKKSILKNSADLSSRVREITKQQLNFSKTSADSLYWFYADTTMFTITRTYWYHDNETGITRVEIAIDHLNSFRFLYDSTAVIFNETEDHLLSVYNLKLFVQTHHFNQIETSISMSGWDDNGNASEFEAVSKYTYNQSRRNQNARVWVVTVTNTINVTTDVSWTISKEFVFSDESKSSHSITFIEGGGTFTKEFRNGTTVTGSFNDLYDDGIGSFESTTTFVANFYIAEIFRSANVVLNRQMQNVTTDLLRIITFANAHIDSVEVNIVTSHGDLSKTSEMTITKSNGAHGIITLVELPDVSTLDGDWTTRDEHYIIITGEKFADGSGTLMYQVYLNEESYDNGDDPIAEAIYNFYGDGRGDGIFTHNATGNTYDMELDDTGKGRIIRNGRSRDINLHRN